MEQLQLSAARRALRGKGGAHQVRREGNIPAIVYGRERSPLPIAVPAVVLRRMLQHAGASTLMVNLRIGEGADAEEQFTVIKEVQREPRSGQVLHVDFQAISLTERLTVTVPIEIVGEAPGVTEGGNLRVVLHSVEVECLPTNVPSSLTADVSGLHLHESLLAGDLALPEGVTLLTGPEEAIVIISVPTAAAPAAEEAAAEEAAAEEK
jgi:large subunit ribosomal protein L25